jgi:hypothetical protein
VVDPGIQIMEEVVEKTEPLVPTAAPASEVGEDSTVPSYSF